MMKPHERYERDVQFRQMVDVMTMQMVDCNYTPTEIREAAMLAAIHYESTHCRPAFVPQDGELRRSDGHHGSGGIR